MTFALLMRANSKMSTMMSTRKKINKIKYTIQ